MARVRAGLMGFCKGVGIICAPPSELYVKSMSQKRKSPARRLGSDEMGQILLADRIVLGRSDNGVTGQIRKARRWAGL